MPNKLTEILTKQCFIKKNRATTINQIYEKIKDDPKVTTKDFDNFITHYTFGKNRGFVTLKHSTKEKQVVDLLFKANKLSEENLVKLLACYPVNPKNKYYHWLTVLQEGDKLTDFDKNLIANNPFFKNKVIPKDKEQAKMGDFIIDVTYLAQFLSGKSVYKDFEEIMNLLSLDVAEKLDEELFLTIFQLFKWDKDHAQQNIDLLPQLLVRGFYLTKKTVLAFLNTEWNPIPCFVALVEAGAKVPKAKLLTVADQLKVYLKMKGYKVPIDKILGIDLKKKDFEVNGVKIPEKYFDPQSGRFCPYRFAFKYYSMDEIVAKFGSIENTLFNLYTKYDYKAVEKLMLKHHISPSQALLAKAIKTYNISHIVFMFGFRVPIQQETFKGMLGSFPSSYENSSNKIIKILESNGLIIDEEIFRGICKKNVELLTIPSNIPVEKIHEILTETNFLPKKYNDYIQKHIGPICQLRYLFKTSNKWNILNYMRAHSVKPDRLCIANSCLNYHYGNEIYTYFTKTLGCKPPLRCLVNKSKDSGFAVDILKQHNLYEEDLSKTYDHIDLTKL